MKLKMLVMITLFELWAGAIPTLGQRFMPNDEPINMITPLRQLNIHLLTAGVEVVPNDRRQTGNKTHPGDYYRSPLGAARLPLEINDRQEIVHNISSIVRKEFYDSAIVSSVLGYKYKLHAEEIERREYYLRYSLADTIYVISGWVGKFLSFYRAVPGHIKYNFKEIQVAVSQLAARDIQISKDAFEKSSRNNPYFIEYIDKYKMIRVRCYHISEIVGFDEKINNFITNPFTLIEITKFIDKEAMP
jgi:hypothetical protein